MKNRIQVYLIITCIMMQITTYTRFFIPKRIAQVNDIISSHELAVVHFINYSVDSSDQINGEEELSESIRENVSDSQYSETGDMLHDMKDAFKRASETSRYQRADVVFVSLDVTKMPNLKGEYNIHNNSVIMLFKNGKLVGRKGREARTSRILTSTSRIRDFIDSYFEDDIDVLLERERASRAENYQQRYAQQNRSIAQNRADQERSLYPPPPPIYKVPTAYHYPTYSREYPQPRPYLSRAYAQHYHPPYYHAPYKMYRSYSLHHPFYGKYHPQYSEFRDEESPYGRDTGYNMTPEKTFRGRYGRSNYVPGDGLHGRRQGFHKNFGWNW